MYAFEEILKKIFKPTRSFYKYVSKKAIFVSSDYFRKNREIPFSDIEIDPGREPGSGCNPEGALLLEEEITIAKERIRQKAESRLLKILSEYLMKY